MRRVCKRVRLAVAVILLLGFAPYPNVRCRGDMRGERRETIRYLRAENKLLKEQVKMLKEAVAELEKVHKALLDRLARGPVKLPAVVDPTTRPKTKVVPKAKTVARKSLAAVLRSMAKDWPAVSVRRTTGLQRGETRLQVKAIEAWCAGHWPGKIVTAKVRVKTVDQIRDRMPKLKLAGELIYPSTPGKSPIRCFVVAVFPLAERPKLLVLQKGATATLVGTIQRPGQDGYIHSPAGYWNIPLVDCKLLSAEKVPPIKDVVPPRGYIPPKVATDKDKWAGFRGLKWGTAIAEVPAMVLLGGDGKGTKYYRRKDDKLAIGGAKLDDIAYGFYKGRFHLVMLHAHGCSNWMALQGAVFARYGKGHQPNRFIESWVWHAAIGGVYMTLEYDEISKKTQLALSFARISAERTADEAKKAKAGGKDF